MKPPYLLNMDMVNTLLQQAETSKSWPDTISISHWLLNGWGPRSQARCLKVRIWNSGATCFEHEASDPDRQSGLRGLWIHANQVSDHQCKLVSSTFNNFDKNR